MSCGCKKKTPVVTNQEQTTQNVTIKLTETNTGSTTTTQTQEELVNKIVAKLNDLGDNN